jgi:ABC-2 type transport system permease protein
MSTVLRQTWWMTERQLKVVVRQPGYLLAAVGQPVIWLFLFGGLFRQIVQLPGFGVSSYLDYLVPGVVVMSALSANMWAGMDTLEEIERGILDRLLITPISRGAIIYGTVAEAALSTTAQSLLVVLLGWAGGARYGGGAAGVAVLILASVVLGVVFSALSAAIGLLVRQRETIIAVNSFLLLPLTFLSSAFMATALMPRWMSWVAEANPVNWALDVGRSAVQHGPGQATVATHGAWLLALAAVMLWLSVRTFRTYQRSV